MSLLIGKLPFLRYPSFGQGVPQGDTQRIHNGNQYVCRSFLFAEFK
jgi:hypothetical protein